MELSIMDTGAGAYWGNNIYRAWRTSGAPLNIIFLHHPIHDVKPMLMQSFYRILLKIVKLYIFIENQTILLCDK